MEEIFIYAKRMTGYMRFTNFVSRVLYGVVSWSFAWVDAPSRGVSNGEMAWELVRGPLTTALPVGGGIAGAAVTPQVAKAVVVGSMQIGSNGIVTSAEIMGVQEAVTTTVSAAEAFEVATAERFESQIAEALVRTPW
jgi:hypothetical protein